MGSVSLPGFDGDRGAEIGVELPGGQELVDDFEPRLSVLTRSAGRRSVLPGAHTPNSIPSASARRASRSQSDPPHTPSAPADPHHAATQQLMRAAHHPLGGHLTGGLVKDRERRLASVHVQTRPSGYRQACRHLLVDAARAEAAIFNANINPATRGCRPASNSSQPVLHTV